MWPRFRLTKPEAGFVTKYPDPRTHKTHVLRRMYTQELNLGPTQRQDAAYFQISRRARVFGITAAGDVDQFLVELIDSTGEQYTAGSVALTNLLRGWNPDPLDEGGLPYDTAVIGGVVATVSDMGPFIQEPSIVLAPNQTLSAKVEPRNPADLVTSLKIEFTWHVWEFPGMPGSPL